MAVNSLSVSRTAAVLLAGAAALGLLAWLSVKPAGGPTSGAAPAELPQTPPAAGPSAQAGRDRQMLLARERLDANDYPGAIAALDRALETKPGDAEALALQVRAFRAQRHYRAARSAALKILETFPQSPMPHILLGSIELQEGDAASARRSFERAAALDTSSALAVTQLATLDLMEGKVDDARRRASQSLALDVHDAAALRILARVTRSVPELISLYRRLLELTPGDLLARSWLEVLRRSGVPEVNYIAPLAGGRARIPCEVGSDGRLHVTADVGSRRKLRLLVDTGASGLVISEARARRWGYRLREFSESSGIDGATRHSHPILIDQIDLGGMRARALMATASNLPGGLDGIVNPAILAPPGSDLVVELRAARRHLLFTRRSSLAAPMGDLDGGRWVTLPFWADGAHILFKIMVGGRPAVALLDTGAAVDILDRSVLHRVPAARLRPASLAGGSLIGFAGQVENAETLEQVPLRIAGRDFPTRSLFVVDLNQEGFRFQIDLDAVVGIGKLSVFDVRIDPGAGTLSFRGATEASPTGAVPVL